MLIHGLVADYAKENGINFLIRGIRSHDDLDSEIIMSLMNRKFSGIETVMLMAKEGKVHVSSTMIRTLGRYGKKLKNFIPDEIEDEVYKHMFRTLKENNKKV